MVSPYAHTWHVHVKGHGIIGSVQEDNEAHARCAALCQHAKEGNRPADSQDSAIYDDDEFWVTED